VPLRAFVRRLAELALLVMPLSGCGARTELLVDEVLDTSAEDTFAVVDAERDTFERDAFERDAFDSGTPIVDSITPDVPTVTVRSCGDAVWAGKGGARSAGTVTTTDGNDAIVAGGFEGGVLTLGGAATPAIGARTVFVSCLDVAGKSLWTRAFGPVSALGRRVAARDTAIVFSATHAGDLSIGGETNPPGILIVGLTRDGGLAFRRAIRAAFYVDVTGIAIGPDLSMLVTGLAHEPLDFGGGPRPVPRSGGAIFVAKLSAKGEHVWSKTFGDGNFVYPRQVAVDATGAVVLTGTFLGSIDFGGGPRSSLGSTNAIYLTKLATDGSHVFSKAFGGVTTDDGRSVAIDGAGNVHLAGTHYGASSLAFGGDVAITGDAMFVAKFAPDGTPKWARAFGGPRAHSEIYEIQQVAVDPKGEVAAIGHVVPELAIAGATLAARGRADAYLIRFTPDGELRCASRWGDGEAQYGKSVSLASNGELLIAGSFAGRLELGGTSVATPIPGDLFVARIRSLAPAP